MKVALPLSWLPENELAFTLTGLSRSAWVACADAHANSAASATANAIARISVLPRLRGERGVDIGEQLQRVGVHVGFHADAAQYRAGLLNHAGRGGGHALVPGPDCGIR